MPTLRTALRTSTDSDFVHAMHQEWLKKPGALDESLDLLAALGDAWNKSRMSQRRVLSQKWKPETLYHVGQMLNWDGEKFPIPHETVSKQVYFLHLVMTTPSQHDSSGRWYWQAALNYHSLPRQHVDYLLANLDRLSFNEKQYLATNKHLTVEEGMKLVRETAHAYRSVLQNQYAPRPLLEAIMSEAEASDDEEHREMVADSLSQNSPKRIAPELLVRIWNLNKTKLTPAIGRISHRPQLPEETLLEMAEAHILAHVPQPALSERVVRAFYADPRGVLRPGLFNHPSAAFLLDEVIQNEQVTKQAELSSMATNPNASEAVLEHLAAYSSSDVRKYVARHPNLSDSLAERLALDPAKSVRIALGHNRAMQVKHRLLALPHTSQAERFLDRTTESREEFFQWAKEEFPELAGLPVDMLADIVVGQMEGRAEEGRLPVRRSRRTPSL